MFTPASSYMSSHSVDSRSCHIFLDTICTFAVYLHHRHTAFSSRALPVHTHFGLIRLMHYDQPYKQYDDANLQQRSRPQVILPARRLSGAKTVEIDARMPSTAGDGGHMVLSCQASLTTQAVQALMPLVGSTSSSPKRQFSREDLPLPAHICPHTHFSLWPTGSPELINQFASMHQLAVGALHCLPAVRLLESCTST